MDVIDLERAITQIVRAVNGGEDLSKLHFLRAIYSTTTLKLEALQRGIDAQQVTMLRLFNHAEKMRDEQLC